MTAARIEALNISLWLAKNLHNTDKSQLLTIRQVADLVNKSPGTVRRWISQGLIKPYGITSRGSARFLVSDILNALISVPKLQRLYAIYN